MLERRVPIALLVTAGVLLPRLYLLFKFRDALIESDEAILGLAALHMMDGQFPVFFYGQHYLGTLEACLLVPFFLVFGAVPIFLKFVPLLLFLGFLGIHYLLAREILPQKRAVLATILVGISNHFLIIWSMKCRGYMPLLVLGTAALYLTARSLKRGISGRALVEIGLLLGLAWWSHFLAIVYIVPIAILFLLKDERALVTKSPWLAGGFLVGSLPFWIYNIRHGWASLTIGGGQQTNIVEDVTSIFGVGFPVILGARPSWGEASFFPFAGLIAGAIVAVSLLGLTRKWFTGIRPSEWEGGQLLLTFVFAYPFLTAISGFSWFMLEPRYLIGLYSALFILVTASISSRRVLAGVSAFFLLLNLWGSLNVDHGQFAAHNNTEPLGPLIRFLDERGIDSVYAPYWVAYRLTFETREKVIATPLANDTLRYPPYLEKVRRSTNPAYVRLIGPVYDQINRQPEPPQGFVRETVGRFEVYLKGPERKGN